MQDRAAQPRRSAVSAVAGTTCGPRKFERRTISTHNCNSAGRDVDDIDMDEDLRRFVEMAIPSSHKAEAVLNVLEGM